MWSNEGPLLVHVLYIVVGASVVLRVVVVVVVLGTAWSKAARCCIEHIVSFSALWLALARLS